MILDLALQKRLGDFSLATAFSVEGRRIGLFGPSGSGKSTLMHLIAGLQRPDQGSIRLDGETLFDSGARINRPPEKRRIGVVFQHAHLFPHLGVKSNLLYGYKRIPRAERRIDPKNLIEVLGLAPLLDRDTGTLSGGERQRVALARTVLSCPRLILLDEPLTGLDAGLKYQIIPYLRKVFSEFAIPLLFISHSLNEMRLMTEQVLEFAGGRLVARSSAEELARRRMGSSPVGYINLLELKTPRQHDGLYSYNWGDRELMLAAGGTEPQGMFELSSKDITLFKRHPEATSARNLLACRVKSIFTAGARTGVELDCGGQTLVSQVVAEAVRDLGLEPGNEIIAVIKASAFRRLY
ncbi:molybdate ABC transporter ATP-binding protein [Desulfuromonas sp. DDH964]|uniref:molybdenum ABC transporter ATP-binding protein n=1 Tax=Desulfuromonas sp. DDH964 TaxID=1823759 RepID=UPI00078C0A44|nr:molybdenum ABC transporter ATP-binding protein [Desulfuromonas sp. DDH964]AMV70481.1 molybdate ABC transporter ATP-binding protein [Desulfuromonas sp. DDH964]